MLDVFLAFLGAPYYTGKLLAEKAEMNKKEAESERRCELWTKRFLEWESQVVDKALQEDLWDYVSKNREAAWLEVQSVYAGMRFQKTYGSVNEWAYDGVLDKTKAGKKSYRHHRMEEPLDIMLAKRGKIRSSVSSVSAHLGRGEGQRTKLEWDRTVEFWTYIRNELRTHGIDAKLIFESERPTKRYFDIDDIEKFRYQSGKLMWLPYTWLDSNLSPL